MPPSNSQSKLPLFAKSSPPDLTTAPEAWILPIHDYKLLPKIASPGGYIYVLQDVSHTQTYKIGRTNHAATRINQFRIELPMETAVKLIMLTNQAAALEKHLHRHYAKQRTMGEWFELSADDLQEIAQMGRQ